MAAKNELKVTETMKAGESLESRNGLFRVTLQTDGNLVARCCGRVYWASGTCYGGANSAPNCKLDMQTDGNLVLRSGLKGKGPWSSGTSLGGPNSVMDARVTLQEDGNLVVRGRKKVLWGLSKYFSFKPNKIYNLVYDETVRVQHTATLGTYSFNVQNSAAIPSPTEVGVDINFVDTSTFEATVGLKVSAETEVSCGLPMLAEGKIKLGVEASFSTTLGKQTSVSQSAHATTTVAVPPSSQGKALLTITQEQFELGFKATADYTFRDPAGKEFTATGPFSGEYKGGNGYSLNSHLIEVEALSIEAAT